MGETFCVLQMPRGNLEVVSPRALVLAAIADALLVRLFAQRFATVCLTRSVSINSFAWVPTMVPRQTHPHAPQLPAGTACDHAKVHVVTLC